MSAIDFRQHKRPMTDIRRVIGDATYLENAPATMPFELPELVDGHVRDNRLRNLTQVLMMREVNHLAHTSHLAEQSENFLRPEMVESLHDVVGNERNRRPELGKLVISGEA